LHLLEVLLGRGNCDRGIVRGRNLQCAAACKGSGIDRGLHLVLGIEPAREIDCTARDRKQHDCGQTEHDADITRPCPCKSGNKWTRAIAVRVAHWYFSPRWTI